MLQSMSGIYQLLPWKPDTIDMPPEAMKNPDFWKTGVEPDRLAKYFQWGESVDTQFFNDRTSIILGDAETITAVAFQDGTLVATKTGPGDGTVPERCALLAGVTDVGQAAGTEHMTLPLSRRVLQTVWRIINANLSVQAIRAPGKPRLAGGPAISALPQAHRPVHPRRGPSAD